MQYDFETPARRRGSGCVKWDAALPEGVTLTPAQRERLIPMWVADMDFVAPPFILDALRRRVEHGVFGYVTVPDSYYDAVIRWFSSRYGLQIRREWIEYTTGVVPALSVAVKAFCQPGEGVILLTPVYNCFFSSVRNNGCQIVDVPLKRRPLAEGRFSYEIPFEELEAACARPEVRLILFCNPHNPAGRVWTAEELQRVGEIARRHGVIVVSDEIHCEIVRPGTAYTPFASVSEEQLQQSVTLCSPSKNFNTAGLQVANIFCARDDWRERIVKAININEVCDVNPFGPVALEAAYSPEGERWLSEMNTVVWQHYDELALVFRRELPDLPVCELEGTYLAWIDVSAVGLSSDEIERALLQEEQVWVNAGAMYGADGFIRINLACPTAQFREGLHRVVEGLKRLLGSR